MKLTTGDIPVHRVLDSARGEVLNVVVVGRDDDGALYFASSLGDTDEVLGLLDEAKAWLLAEAEAA